MDSNLVREIIIGVVSGVIAIPVWAGLVWLYRRFQARRIRRFWKPFLQQKIGIIMTEYHVTGSDAEARIARQAGAGFLVSLGNALAMSRLERFILQRITNRDNLHVWGDKRGSQTDDDYLVIAGSPVNNHFSTHIFSSLEDRFHLPYSFHLNPATGEISIQATDGERFEPKIENGDGIDYAMVVRAKYRDFHPDHALVLAGAYMYGTQAAAYAVTREEIIKQVCEQVDDAENLAFLLETRVINYEPKPPALWFRGKVHVHVLASRQADVKVSEQRETR